MAIKTIIEKMLWQSTQRKEKENDSLTIQEMPVFRVYIEKNVYENKNNKSGQEYMNREYRRIRDSKLLLQSRHLSGRQ